MQTALNTQSNRHLDDPSAPAAANGARTAERVTQALFAASKASLYVLLLTLIPMLWTAAAWATGMRPEAPAVVVAISFALAAFGATLARATALADRRALPVVIAGLAAAAVLIAPARPAVLQSSPSLIDGPIALGLALAKGAGIPLVTIGAMLWMLCTRHPNRTSKGSLAAGPIALAAYPILIEPLASLQDLARIWTILLAATAVVAIALTALRFNDTATSTASPGRRTIVQLLLHSAIPSATLVVIMTEAAATLTPLALPASALLALALAAAYLPMRLGTGRSITLPLPSPAFLVLTTAVAAVIALPEMSRYRLPLALTTLMIGTALHARPVREHLRTAPQASLPIALAGIAVGALLATILVVGRPLPPLPFALILLVCASPGIAGSRYRHRRVGAILLLSIGAALVLPVLGGILGVGSRIVLAAALAVAVILIVRGTAGWPEQNLVAASSFLAAAALFPDPSKVVHAERGTWAPYSVVAQAGSAGHRLVSGNSTIAHDPPDHPASLSRLFAAVRDLKRSDPALEPDERSPLLIGVIGTGGTLACATSPTDVVRYFATDGASARLSTDLRWFPSYTRCTSTARIVSGDLRTIVAAEPDEAFDVLILDTAAFPASPLHLLDGERLSTLLAKTAPAGLLIIRERAGPVTVAPWLARILAVKSGLQSAIVGDDLIIVTPSALLATAIAAWPDSNGLERDIASSPRHHIDLLAVLRFADGPRR